jgi:hypothetical protein
MKMEKKAEVRGERFYIDDKGIKKQQNVVRGRIVR